MSTVISQRPAAAPTGRARDPFIDVLRTCAILVVVCGHWIMPVLSRQGDTLVAGNSLATPGWWLLTWPLQVMPVFFFAGGAANLHSHAAALRRGGTTRGWLAARLCRLAVPVLPLLAVWLVVPGLLRGLGVPGQPVALAAGIVGQLVWFLAVYVLTVVAVPLARRWGWSAAVPLGVAALGVDALRLHGVPLVGYVNELLVWLAVSQLGIAYAAGRFDRLSRRAATLLGVAGFTATAVLVLFGHYPDSMVGLPGQAMSNMSPATVCLLCLGVGQVGLLLAMRQRIVAWANRPGPRAVLAGIGPRGMTVYLWHMPALVAAAGVAVLGFGYTTPAPGSVAWLVMTPLWLAALACVLRLLVRGFGRFETIRPTSGTPPVRRLAAAVPLLCAGFVGIAAFGFANPLLALPSAAAVVGGLVLVWPDLVTRSMARLLDVVFR
jgi:fucose 4-O-acetylase-like acetyltransferase